MPDGIADEIIQANGTHNLQGVGILNILDTMGSIRGKDPDISRGKFPGFFIGTGHLHLSLVQEKDLLRLMVVVRYTRSFLGVNFCQHNLFATHDAYEKSG